MSESAKVNMAGKVLISGKRKDGGPFKQMNNPQARNKMSLMQYKAID